MARILLINAEYPPLGGGSGTATRQLALAMARRGHKPFVITAAFDGLPTEEDDHGITVRRIRAWRRQKGRVGVWELLRFTIAAMIAAPRLARQWQVESAIIALTLPTGLIGWLLKRTAGVPYTISLQGVDVPGHGRATGVKHHHYFGNLTRKLWTEAGAVVASSNGMAMLAREHAPGIHFNVIPTGADMEGLAPGDRTDRTGPVKILYAGRLVKDKGLDVLMAALGKLPDTLNWSLTLAGEGAEWTALAGYAARYRVAGHIEFRGWTGWEALPEIYREADVFVMPSRKDDMPVAVLEAMAAGLPVIGTRVGGMTEMVSHGVTGLLVPPEDVDSLTAALTTVISDSAKRVAMGRAGRTRADARYSWTAVAEHWLEVLSRLPGVKRKGKA